MDSALRVNPIRENSAAFSTPVQVFNFSTFEKFGATLFPNQTDQDHHYTDADGATGDLSHETHELLRVCGG
jgi:hypothetical protein